MNIDWLEDPSIFNIGLCKPHCFLSHEPDFIINLNGIWDFKFMENEWTTIPVPANIQAHGFGDLIRKSDGNQLPNSTQHNPSWKVQGIYKKKFKIPKSWSEGNIFLSFGAVNTASAFWLNGQFLGYNQDSRTEIEFDISTYLSPEENEIKVQIYDHCKSSLLDCPEWRLIGIERDVNLFYLPQKHIKDYKIETSWSEEKNGGFDLEMQLEHNQYVEVKLYDNIDLIYQGRCEGKLSILELQVQAWSHEFPYLYQLELCLYDNNTKVHSQNTKIGFRSIKIENGLLYLNDKYLTIKGVNRIEHNEKSLNVVYEEDMLLDIKMMKDANINVVRNSFETSGKRWYELCDKYGLLVIDEVTTDGYYINDKLEQQGKYSNSSDPIRDRVERIYHRSKNHACIIGWSLGGHASNPIKFRRAYDWLKSRDDRRLVLCRQAKALDKSDIYCPPYSSLQSLEDYALSKPSKALILSTYSKGNSLGNFAESWDLIERHVHLQGGFIYSLFDRGIKTNESQWSFAKDYNSKDVCSDRMCCLSGLLLPDRTPHPSYYEVKKVYQDLSFNFDEDDDVLILKSKRLFESIIGVLEVRIWDKEKQWYFERFNFELAAGSSDLIALDSKSITSSQSLFMDAKAFINNGELAAEEQFVLSKCKGSKHKPLLPIKFPYTIKPNLFKAPNINDLEDKYFEKYGKGMDTIPELEEEYIGDGIIRLTLSCNVQSHIPRFGITIDLPKTFSELNYLGRGPHENYPDRKRSAHWGKYYSTLIKLRPTYIITQESAYRCENEELTITDSEGHGFRFTSENTFGFSYLPFSQKDLLQGTGETKINADLIENEFYTLCIDSHMVGLGDIQHEQLLPLEKYQLNEGKYKFVLYITAL